PDMLDVHGVSACLARLQKIADLKLYTTEIAVDDLDEVREALGYPQINIYGTSYGTRVAQVYMRRHPTALRTVSMKGIVPPSLAAPSTHSRSGEQAWQQLVTRCATNDECARNYPKLRDDLGTLLHRLEAQPV